MPMSHGHVLCFARQKSYLSHILDDTVSRFTKNSIIMKGDEISTYPTNKHILFKSTTRSWNYEILEEGVYPPSHKLAYTKKPESFPIPHQYLVRTMYGKKDNLAECSIDYVNEKPFYKIRFGINMEILVYA